MAQAQPAGAPAQAAPPPAILLPTKIAVIPISAAITTTQEGKKVNAEIAAKYLPKRTELEKKQADIVALQDQMKKGSATMSEEAKTKLVKEIDAKSKLLQRETDDAQTDLDQDENKVMQELGGKMTALIEQYAAQNGYAIVIDVGSQQTPVIWAARSGG